MRRHPYFRNKLLGHLNLNLAGNQRNRNFAVGTARESHPPALNQARKRAPRGVAVDSDLRR